MIREEIREELFRLQDEKYCLFQGRLIPTVEQDSMIGVRTPQLRKLAKQYEAVLPYIEGKKLDPWTHNKAIQKSVESSRITPEQKVYLKSLKVSPK